MSESRAPAARADESVTEKPATEKPAIEEPVTEELVAAQPVGDEPVDDELVAEELAGDEPVAEEPVADGSAPTPGPGRRHRRRAAPVAGAPRELTIVLGARTVAALRFVRTSAPLALVAATLVACTSASGPPAPPTARVERASVTTAVSSSGSLSAITEQNLGFTKAGQLKTVEVTVGQRVTAGQVLATIDDGPARRLLSEQQGQLDSQRAALARQVNATTVRGAQNTTNQAQDILSATQDQQDQVIQADKDAVDRAKKQLDVAQDARDNADDTLDDAEDACKDSGGSSGSSSSSGGIDTSAIISGLGSSGSASSDDDGKDDDDKKESAEEKRRKLEAALKAAGALAGSLTAGGSAGSANSACSQVASAQSAADNARAQVETARTNLVAAQNRVDVDEASQQVSVENAQQGVVTAQNNLESARTDRPSLISQQRGLVTAQEAVVRQAQQDVNDTVLRAPADGTVTAVNGAVGEFLTAGSTTTPLAPGSQGAIPGAGQAAATPGAVARPGGTQFLVLDNVDQFDVVVPFEESDAVQIAPGQRVNVSFDAIPDLTLPGTVESVSPSASALSGVISYYATVRLTQSDPRLRNGQTAQAAVLTTALDDVLTVPNAAVRREGAKSTVTVLGFDGPRTVEFQPGVVGDDRTQVLSGLTAGDEVVVPSGR